MKISASMAANLLASQYENMTGCPAPDGIEDITTFDEMQAAMPQFSSIHTTSEEKTYRARSVLVRPHVSGEN